MLRPPDRHGNPRGRRYREYCALPRQWQGYTTCPGHRDRLKRVNGIVSGELVRFEHRRHGLVQGRGTLINNKTRVSVSWGGRQISVRWRDAVLLERNCGVALYIGIVAHGVSPDMRGMAKCIEEAARAATANPRTRGADDNIAHVSNPQHGVSSNWWGSLIGVGPSEISERRIPGQAGQTVM